MVSLLYFGPVTTPTNLQGTANPRHASPMLGVVSAKVLGNLIALESLSLHSPPFS